MNIVFLTAINQNNEAINYAQFSIETWKYWCKKNQAYLFIYNKERTDLKGIKPTWQRWKCFEILEEANIKYNKIFMVDIDTLVMPHCPSPFSETNQIGVCRDTFSLAWLLNSLDAYKKYFPNINLDWTNYFNCGVILLSPYHKTLGNKIFQWYLDTKNLPRYTGQDWGFWGNKYGTDQTPVNYIIKEEGYKIKFLSEKYNVSQLEKKDIFKEDTRIWWDKFNYNMLIKESWILHFNAIKMHKKYNYIKKVFDKL